MDCPGGLLVVTHVIFMRDHWYEFCVWESGLVNLTSWEWLLCLQ